MNPCHGDDHLHGCGGLTAGAVCRGGRNGGLSGSQRRHHAVFVHGNLFRIVGLVGHGFVGGILRADGDGQLRRLSQNDAVFLLSECHGLGQPNHLYLDGAGHFRHFGAGGGDRDRAGAESLHPSVLIHRGNAFIGGSPRQLFVVGVLGQHRGLHARRFVLGQRAFGQFQLNFLGRLAHLHGHAGLGIAVLGFDPDRGASPAYARHHAVFIHRGDFRLPAFVGHALQSRVVRGHSGVDLSRPAHGDRLLIQLGLDAPSRLHHDHIQHLGGRRVHLAADGQGTGSLLQALDPAVPQDLCNALVADGKGVALFGAVGRDGQLVVHDSAHGHGQGIHAGGDDHRFVLRNGEGGQAAAQRQKQRAPTKKLLHHASSLSNS